MTARRSEGELDVVLPPDLSRVALRPAQPAQQQLTYGQQIVARLTHQELRHEQNLEKIVYYATEEEGDGNVAQDREADEEWLTQFFKNAQDVSTEQLQRLWARLLAGEIKSPGTYSIDTIDFLRRMTSARARQIQNIGPYLFQKMIVRCKFIEDQDWSNFVFWLDMENLGMVDGAGGLGLQSKFASQSPKKYERYFAHGVHVLICRHDDGQKILEMPCYRMTTLGLEILSLGKFVPDYEYLLSVAELIKSKSFKVSLGDIVEMRPDGNFKARNVREIA